MDKQNIIQAGKPKNSTEKVQININEIVTEVKPHKTIQNNSNYWKMFGKQLKVKLKLGPADQFYLRNPQMKMPKFVYISAVVLL